jgi:hypothetical protein
VQRNVSQNGELDPDATQSTEVSCASSTEPEPAAQEEWNCNSQPSETQTSEADCSSDSSASGQSESCASDTADASQPQDESCASDTAQTNEPQDDGCGADTADTKAPQDESCDSGSPTDSESDTDDTTGYDGETCTGQATPKSSTRSAALLVPSAGVLNDRLEQNAKRPARPKRLRLSLWSVAFAALVLPLRRRKRRRGLGY